jgi:hypothetical protein
MTVDSQAESQGPLKDVRKSVLSKEERWEIVSSFYKTYLSGKLKLNAWTPGLVVSMRTGETTPGEQLLQEKKQFMLELSVACGMGKPTTQEAIDDAVDGIFLSLLSWRSSGLIEGEFSTIDQEARLKALEDRSAGLEKLMSQLIEEVRMLSHVRGSNPP